MKCPICGNEEFRESDHEGYIEDTNPHTHHIKRYVCVHCGLTLRFDDFFVRVNQAKKEYNDLVKQRDKIEKEIEKIKAKYHIADIFKENELLEKQKDSLDITKRQIMEIEKKQEENIKKIEKLKDQQRHELHDLENKLNKLNGQIYEKDRPSNQDLHLVNINSYKKLQF